MGFIKKIKSSIDSAVGADDDELMASPLIGAAAVDNVQITGTSVQRGGAPPEQVCVFSLTVFLDDTDPYPAQARKRLPQYVIAQITPGSTEVTVRVDPNDHSRVAVDLTTETPKIRLKPKAGQLTVADIMEKGTPAQAVIVDSSPLGVTNSKGLDMYKFTLTVLREGTAPYQIQVGLPVTPEAVPLLYPGSKVAVKYLPDGKPEECAIDWDTSLAQVSGGASPS
jgi:hypothetical protein